MEEYLTPGFRFYPTEEELVSFYLHKKLEGTRQDLDLVIPVVYIYEFNPWDLPEFAGELCRKDPEQWFFFIPRQEKEARGGRPNRLTTCGYWKATGSPGFVYSSSGNRIIGVKRTMVFYKGRAPTGRKTEWKMNEYRTITFEGDPSSSSTNTETPEQRQDHEYSLCRVYVKKSKCLRAFDRRPSAMTISNAVGLMVDHHPQSSLLQNYCPNNPRLLTETTTSSSPDQGSWEDHANPNYETSGSHDNWDLIAFDNNEVLLDWEQLNWF